MREAHVNADTNVTVKDVPAPKILDPDDIIVRVAVAGCNPKDWKMPAGILKTIAECPNSGDDIAGVVEQVGSAVLAFRPGDRVAALHQLGAPAGAYAEFARVKEYTTFHIGLMPFERAATLPMATFMAAIGLFGTLRLTSGLWDPVVQPTPLLIYGASSSVGSMAVKFGQAVNAHPMICIAGGGAPLVESLIDRSKGDVIIDYRAGDDALVGDAKAALRGRPLLYALDAVSEHGSYMNIAQVLEPHRGRITLALPGHAHNLPTHFHIYHMMAGSLWQKLKARKDGEALGNLGIDDGGPEFARAYAANIGAMVRDGRIQPPPFEVIEGGLDHGLERALKLLRAGKVSAKKLIIQVAETKD
ncbi:hypothetical protein MBLNU457_5251t1 [Dothideomycetes sp. NU457]